LYAGQDVTVSGEFNSEKVVTLCAVLPHGVFHGQNAEGHSIKKSSSVS
jgi:hypothetical protein